MIALDARPLCPAATRALEGGADVAVVVEVELGRLEQVEAAVRGEEPL